MKEISFCVILYNKKLSESSSILTLINYFQNNEVLGKIIVFNNGPNIVENEFPNYITLHQILVNASLSKIYNKFITEYNADHYIFLDDDSILSNRYLNELKKNKDEIFIPQIFCHGTRHFPIYDRRNEIQSITSGLTLSKKICNKLMLQYNYVFDERLDLYGIDTAFFYKLNEKGLKYTVSENHIEHDLSHLTSGDNSFREIEVLLANSASLIPYFKFRLLLRVGYGILKMLVRLKFQVVFSAFFSILLKRTIRVWKY